MTIDLNDPLDFTVDHVRTLIALGADNSNSQLRVSKASIASLVNTEGAGQPGNLAFHIETWIAGRGYVGEKASQDEEWIRRLYEALKDNWPNPIAECIDLF